MENVFSAIDIPPLIEQPNQVDLLVGDQVYRLLDDSAFKEAWHILYTSCAWATAFQSWEFIATWYLVFKNDYTPVLLKFEQEGRLTGLLAMAIPDSDRVNAEGKQGSVRFVGAGEYEAEYQCWIAEPENSDYFITSALTKLLQHYPKARIMFRFLPPHIPLAWLDHDHKWRKLCVKQAFKRPLLEIKSPLAEKAFRITNQYKTKLNRLKKIGTVKFERVTEQQVFESVLPEITLQFDFRQGGLFNKNQFRDKPLKGEFMKELFRHKLLHVTLLKVNEDIIGSMVAVADRGWVYLQGINTHSPFYAKHSPGILHFLNLGQLLAHEGVDVFDLTPGGDTYKERLATSHDQVYGLLITSHKGFRLKRMIKKELQDYLVRTGRRPMTVELQIKKQVYLLKNRLNSAKKIGYTSAIRQLLRSDMDRALYHLDTKNLSEGSLLSAMHIKKNSLNDMLDFDKDTELTRWEFLENTMRLFELGHHAYTWAEGGRLMACAWFAYTDFTGPEQLAQTNIPALMHFYCHPEAGGRFEQFLEHVTALINQETHEPKLYAVHKPNSELLIRSGFKSV